MSRAFCWILDDGGTDESVCWILDDGSADESVSMAIGSLEGMGVALVLQPAWVED